MTSASSAALGVFLFMVAGFLAGSRDFFGPDPELKGAVVYGLFALGLVGVIFGSVSAALRAGRD